MGTLHEVSCLINAWKHRPDHAVERSMGITTNHKAPSAILNYKLQNLPPFCPLADYINILTI